ncbi:hypothetical protein PF010_g24323 [Phytophthora fragariae]|uniref:Uncharacterized protein n=1 Tax=Phytophthora fragariae TaxID=53985 RepID=A0A6A3DUG6_9STRA|nr:hypothetical protein PF009_g25976 [Phytophthora fragariae]KAE9075373.1 hypothetical protein PF010_g24323 [Phytophthora fragariae]KAE9093235.1 hypothetical protein PF006_g24486 [Phytophthora fragariae]KAE9279946.1 hypothetical protein PF001_g24463 [Phytophthora fragariae]KAE9294035.1 hypothetical protein PF008_g24645 [Phytophthora fragariae]
MKKTMENVDMGLAMLKLGDIAVTQKNHAQNTMLVKIMVSMKNRK